MLFNSAVFLVFATVFFLFWPAARRRPNLRYAYLVAAAAVFYGWWDWRFLFLLFVPGVVDFALVRAMATAGPSGRRALFAASVVLNLGSLVIFKYTGWFVELLTGGLAAAGVDANLREAVPHVFFLLPIGVSFYTFQALTYTIDVHNGRLQPTPSLLHYLAFKSLFPLLLAGPIMRADQLLPQLAASREPTADDRWQGLKLIVFGFFQKLVIADGLAPYVNMAFDASAPPESSLYWWIIVVAYAFQIYCDFGGYSNIACGLGRWMGYDLTLNFRHPYLATSLSEFWTRWHISLSSWIWRYIFTPLTYGALRLVGRLNLPTVEQEMRLAYPPVAIIAMLLCGLWHGAGPTFVVWGLIHGLLLSWERLTNMPKRLKRLPRGRDLAVVVTVLQVGLTWVFFRATTLDQASAILRRLFSFTEGFAEARDGFGGFLLLNLAILLTVAVAREAWHHYGLEGRLPFSPATRARLELAAVVLVIPLCVYLRGPGARFIYFQF
jgi:alginate O-acetyltransferase complex protein AlgI